MRLLHDTFELVSFSLQTDPVQAEVDNRREQFRADMGTFNPPTAVAGGFVWPSGLETQP